jgi:hypothetical protein
MKAFRLAAAGLCLALLVLGVWWLVHPAAWFGDAAWFFLMAGVWILFAAACWLIRKVPAKAAIALILLGGLALPLAAGFAPPRTSDDLYRYIWDGRVQLAGVDPYAHVPAAPQLAGIRDDFLWPGHSAWCVPPGRGDLVAGCTMINRPTVNTIYPPTAQAYFTAVQLFSPSGSREGPIQLASALFAVAVTVLLLAMLPRLGADPRLAALWAWCPLVALETGNNAHLDVVAAFLTAAGLIVAARAKTWRATAAGAALLALAITTKVTPVLAGPSILRRRPLVVMGAATLTVAAVYVPHLLAVGPGVLGYLPDYLTAEGYATGTRFALLASILPPQAAAVAAIAILLATVTWALLRGDPDRPWDTAVVTAGVFLLVSTPGYSWYAMLLVVLVALSGRAEWLAVAAGGYVAQYAANLHLTATAAQQIGYGVAALIVVAVSVMRRPALRHARVALAAGR